MQSNEQTFGDYIAARDRQVGGQHYKQYKGYQPWDIIDVYKLDYYAGNVLKYLLRYPQKHGKEDLMKARHFLDKMIEDYDANAS